MKRLRIMVSGHVQRVGYRDRVAEIARKLGTKGTVYNLEDEVSVEIIAEGEDSKIEEFLKMIQIVDPPIEVEKIDAKEENPIGEFKYFKIKRGEPNEELGERIDVAGKLLYKSLEKQDKMLEKQDSMLGKQDSMLEKQDSMLEKQDSTVAAIKGVDHKQDLTITAIKGMKDKMENKFDTLDVKYGKVSEKLGSIDTHLKELVDILRAFKPQ